MTGIALDHGKLFRPDLSKLLPADYLFNPTIVRWDGSLWMIYRRVTLQEGLSLVEWPRTLAMCRVDEDLQPELNSNVDLSAQIDDAPGARRWHADPRLFLREGGPWVSFHDNHDLYIARLRPNRVGERLSPKRYGIDGSEKTAAREKLGALRRRRAESALYDRPARCPGCRRGRRAARLPYVIRDLSAAAVGHRALGSTARRIVAGASRVVLVRLFFQ